MRQYTFRSNSNNFVINSANCKVYRVYLWSGLEPKITGNTPYPQKYKLHRITCMNIMLHFDKSHQFNYSFMWEHHFFIYALWFKPLLTETQVGHKIKVGCIKNATLVSQDHKTEAQTVAITGEGLTPTQQSCFIIKPLPNSLCSFHPLSITDHNNACSEGMRPKIASHWEINSVMPVVPLSTCTVWQNPWYLK